MIYNVLRLPTLSFSTKDELYEFVHQSSLYSCRQAGQLGTHILVGTAYLIEASPTDVLRPRLAGTKAFTDEDTRSAFERQLTLGTEENSLHTSNVLISEMSTFVRFH